MSKSKNVDVVTGEVVEAGAGVPKAEWDGELPGLGIKCAVLADGTRVLSERSTTDAFGGKRGGSHWRRKAEAGGGHLPPVISANNFAPYIPDDLREKLANPIRYQGKNGGTPAFGLRAETLPELCGVILDADKDGATSKAQEHIVEQAHTIIRALAHVGVIALVDEATGYQEVRDRQELQKILAIYISPELLPWTKRFPDEFYEEMFRLWGWKYSPFSVKRPSYVGKLTNKLVYEKLPPGVLPELQKVNPYDPETKRRAKKHHQYLTEDIGNEHLARHLAAVIALMKAAPNRAQFERMFARAFPNRVQQLELAMSDPEDDS